MKKKFKVFFDRHFASGPLAPLFLALVPALILAILPTTHAGDLRAPFDFESAAVLPQGVRNPRFKNLILFMDEKFGGNWASEPLGYRLNKTVTWADVVDGQSDASLKAITQGKISSLGLSLNGAAGSTSGVVNTYANVKIPVLAYGVTPKLTVAVAVPIVSVQVNADTGFLRSEDGQRFVDDVCRTDPDKCNEAARKLNDAVNTKLERLGYEPIRSFALSQIGDVKVVGKYQVLDDGRNLVALKPEVTLPTGVAPNSKKALDIPTGDGQVDLGLTVVGDHFLDEGRSWRATGYAGYTVQLPDSLERHIPVSGAEPLSSDVETLDRDLGDIATAGTSLIYEFPFGLNLGAGYSFQHLNATSFSGSKFDPARYQLLDQNTRQVLHSATFGVGFSSVAMYKQKKFKVPFQANVTYNKPLAGMNVVKNEYLAFEVVGFF